MLGLLSAVALAAGMSAPLRHAGAPGSPAPNPSAQRLPRASGHSSNDGDPSNDGPTPGPTPSHPSDARATQAATSALARWSSSPVLKNLGLVFPWTAPSSAAPGTPFPGVGISVVTSSNPPTAPNSPHPARDERRRRAPSLPARPASRSRSSSPRRAGNPGHDRRRVRPRRWGGGGRRLGLHPELHDRGARRVHADDHNMPDQ